MRPRLSLRRLTKVLARALMERKKRERERDTMEDDDKTIRGAMKPCVSWHVHRDSQRMRDDAETRKA